MAIETWGKYPYGAIWFSLIMLFITLIFGVQGYNGKTNFGWAAIYTATMIILSGLNAAVLGQYMYDGTTKYDVWGSLGTAVAISASNSRRSNITNILSFSNSKASRGNDSKGRKC